MRRPGSIVAVLALIATPLAAQQTAPAPRPIAPQPTTTPAAPASRSILASTQALFDRYVAENKLPGLVGAFGVGDFPPVFVAAGRIADDPGAAAAGPDSLWRVYSMT